MNAKDFDEIVAARMAWCNKTLCAKGDEYARDGDRLWNFKVAGRKLDCHPAEALAGMMIKHTVSVDDIIDGLSRGIVPPKEIVAEKIGDSINYLLLLEGLIEEERQMECPVVDAEFEPWQTAISEQEAQVRAQVATSARAKDTARDAMATSAQGQEAMNALASACGYTISPLLASASRVEDNGPNWASLGPLSEVYGGHVVCPGCGLMCSIGREQEQSVTLTGRCTLCRAEKERETYFAMRCGKGADPEIKERETYTVPPLQDGDDDPAVHIVPDKTSRSTLPSGCLSRLCGRGDDDGWQTRPE